MDKEIKLTKDELSVLKVCNEEPGKIENIQRELKDKLSKEKRKGILDRLAKLKLVYEEEGWWAITVEGGRELPN